MNVLSAPAYSFSVKSLKKQSEPTPGPGEYEPQLSHLKSMPNIKIGKSQRIGQTMFQSPGPGTYDSLQSTLIKSGPTIGNSKRTFLSTQKETPGPGTYEFRPKSVEGPKYSIIGRNELMFNKPVPGPGQYESDQTDLTNRQKAPSYTIGNESKTSRPSSAFTPGPGSYETERKYQGPQWKFGSQSRESLILIEKPGPGVYSIPETASQSKNLIRPRQPTPGPGSYNPNSVRPKSPTWKIGTSSRDEFKKVKFQSPGPADYSNSLNIHSSSAVFGKALKKSCFEDPSDYEKGSGACEDFEGKTKIRLKRTPGPGQYNVKKEINGPRWHFGTASKDKKMRSETPGPGSYTVYSTMSNLPSYVRISRN